MITTQQDAASVGGRQEEVQDVCGTPVPRYTAKAGYSIPYAAAILPRVNCAPAWHADCSLTRRPFLLCKNNSDGRIPLRSGKRGGRCPHTSPLTPWSS